MPELLYHTAWEGDDVLFDFKCPICDVPVRVRVRSETRLNQTMYPFEVTTIHGDPPHGVLLYVDKKGAVRGTSELQHVEMTASHPTARSHAIVPRRSGKLSPMATRLGVVTPREFEVYQQVDGQRNAGQIAAALDDPLESVVDLLKALQGKRLIKPLE